MSDHILVIDDDPELQEILKIALEDAGHRVHGSLDGASGVEYMIEHDVDLVLLDIMMPGMDGYEVCRKLKAVPATSVPVIFLSARTMVEDVDRAYAVGADDYISKPFDMDDLRDRVINALTKRQGENSQ